MPPSEGRRSWTKNKKAGYFLMLPHFLGASIPHDPRVPLCYGFFEADFDAIAREIPKPLELVPDPICMAWIGDAHQPPHTYGRYHEGIIGITVKYGDTAGWYSPYMWVHTDEALIAGHLYGFPKQICDDTPIERVGNQINAIIQRRGQPLCNMVFVFTSPPASKRNQPEEAKLGALLGPRPWLQLKENS